jgi:myo-inositol-1(or 4)-monophosphatase
VIDPLDGTVNYLYGIPAWCVSVACEDDDGALVGVVHDPGRGETFAAARGRGAQLGCPALHVNDPVPLERALVATGFAYAAERRAIQGRTVAALLPRVRDVRRGGSAALDMCAVAAGRVDGYYEEGPSAGTGQQGCSSPQRQGPGPGGTAPMGSSWPAPR